MSKHQKTNRGVFYLRRLLRRSEKLRAKSIKLKALVELSITGF
jgi:hypothetical protein